MGEGGGVPNRIGGFEGNLLFKYSPHCQHKNMS